jgi:hypothetical protein
MNNSNYFCHEEDINTHSPYCVDESACCYGQPDGPDDYLQECECIIKVK